MAIAAPPVLIDRHADTGVAVATLNQPERRNALSDEMLAALAPSLDQLDLDPAIRCIVIAGDDKSFAAGGDIRALSQRTAMEICDGDRSRYWAVMRGIRTPVLAAVSGYCLGGGCELAMSADVVIASETARFGLPETSLGLIPGAGGTQMLPRSVGKAKAMDLVLTGRLLDAQEAERAGLVSRIVDADGWLEAAVTVAERIAARPAAAQRLVKESVRAAFETGLQAGLGVERNAFGTVFGTEDAREGLQAFLEKRDPRWQHR